MVFLRHKILLIIIIYLFIVCFTISTQAPDHCSHVQTLLYNYTVMSNGVELQCNGPSSSTETDFEGIVEINTNYTLHVMHWESGGLPQLVTKAFSEL